MINDLQVKRLEKGDTGQIITCMTEARGINYYTADQLSEGYLFSNDFELYGAFLGSNEIVGFAGITHSVFSLEMSKLTLLNVSQGFTGRGVATALLRHLVADLSKRSIKAIKSHAVTWHSSAQRILEELGLRPAGLLWGVKDGKNITPSLEGKCSLVVMAKKVSVEHPIIIYPHRDIMQVAMVAYEGINVKVQYKNIGTKSEKSILAHSYSPHDEVLYIQVIESGDDLTEKLNHTTTGFENTYGFTSIILLNIEAPSAIYGYDKILDCGYKFSGFDPLGEFEYAIFYKCNTAMGEVKTTERIGAFLHNVGIVK